jgi:hypothetical protein
MSPATATTTTTTAAAAAASVTSEDDDDIRCRRVFLHLDALCMTNVAQASLRGWQISYARKTRREALLPVGAGMADGDNGGEVAVARHRGQGRKFMRRLRRSLTAGIQNKEREMEGGGRNRGGHYINGNGNGNGNGGSGKGYLADLESIATAESTQSNGKGGGEEAVRKKGMKRLSIF